MTSCRVTIADSSTAGQARRTATMLAERCGMDATQVGRVAIVATELATNLLKHGGGGEILIQSAGAEVGAGLDLLAIDRGRGIDNAAEALRDGHSSSGTPGTGLGAITRLSNTFDLYSQRNIGTVVFSRILGAGAKARGDVGGVNVPHPRETVSGDAYAVRRQGNQLWLLLADGLGHGPDAAAAANTATRAFATDALDAPAAVLERIHGALRPTRGAAVGVTQIDPARSALLFSGLGNIAGTIATGGLTRSLVSHHGTAGHDVGRTREFTYEWPRSSVLVLHSDGLTSRWGLAGYPGLLARHPVLIAAVLYRDQRRGTDDASVLVVRGEA